MARRVTWRSWAVLAAGFVIYAVLGWWLSMSAGMAETWIYRIGLTATTLGAAAFAVSYALGSRGWWRTDVSATLVRLALALIPLAAPLAIAEWFYYGKIGPSWLGWLAISGPCLSALFLFRASWIWFRLGRAAGTVPCPDGHRAPAGSAFCPVCGKPITPA